MERVIASIVMNANAQRLLDPSLLADLLQRAEAAFEAGQRYLAGTTPGAANTELYAAIERAAAADFRSVNAEVEVLLREALDRRGVKVGVTEAPRRGRPPAREGSGYE